MEDSFIFIDFLAVNVFLAILISLLSVLFFKFIKEKIEQYEKNKKTDKIIWTSVILTLVFVVALRYSYIFFSEKNELEDTIQKDISKIYQTQENISNVINELEKKIFDIETLVKDNNSKIKEIEVNTLQGVDDTNFEK